MNEDRKFIGDGRTKKIKIGSSKTYKGWTIYIFLCVEFDIRRLNYRSWFQLELEKGDVVHSQRLEIGIKLIDLDNIIYKKIDKLVLDQLKK